MASGVATAYALNALEDRGILFISPGDKVYEGMIIGESSRDTDLEVNPAKAKVLVSLPCLLFFFFLTLN